MQLVQNIISFFTDAHSIGFPLLIGVGLWGIIYFMNTHTKRPWHAHPRAHGDNPRDPGLPIKPF